MKIVLTGGGTAGHVTPNIALMPALGKSEFEAYYIGTENGMEHALIKKEGIPYFSIKAGKLRRYLDFKNLTDTLKIGAGFFQAVSILRSVKPDIIFSKGGFVSCPVVWAAWFNRIPVVIHESDMTPGLANRLSIPFATKICYTFPETGQYLKNSKAVYTGMPVRASLINGNRISGLKICGFSGNKPVVLVIGGSQGSNVINLAIRDSINILLDTYNICHICGKGGVRSDLQRKGYKQFDYVNEELPHLFAASDLIIARAGATSLYELLALKKPNLLIPLSRQASRGDQILNARSFEKQGFSKVLPEEEMNRETLVSNIDNVYKNRNQYIKKMEAQTIGSGVENVVKVLLETLKLTH